MLTTSEKMLLDAQKAGYAVGAFNVENMEMAQAVVGVAVELRSPVMVQFTPSTLRYAPPWLYGAMVAALAERADVPVCLHLDHGSGFDLTAQALRAGFTSLMIDGSHEPYEENIALTRRVVEMARPNGVPVEAELGKVGGKEDDLDAGEGGGYTVPAQAADFVARTGVSSLAVAIGTAHGLYRGEPKLDIRRLGEIRQAVSIPLVLHGASGLSEKQVRDCIQAGACKVNFATELRIAYWEGVKGYLQEKPQEFDPKKYGGRGREHVMAIVRERMIMCGCQGKA